MRRDHISADNVTRLFKSTVNLPGIRDHIVARIFIVPFRIHTWEKPCDHVSAVNVTRPFQLK